MLLDLLLPRRCVVCGGPAEVLCAVCRLRLRRLSGPHCERCGAPTSWPVGRCRECAGRRIAFATARAAVVYDDAARRVVAAWKDRGLRKLCGLAADLISETVPRPRMYTMSFVPADEDRWLERGHNPAQRLADELGSRWQLPVVSLLSRPPGTRPQRGLSRDERKRNVRGLFSATAEAPKALVLVDDVYTSGATVSAAASALRNAGARRVEVVTFARAVR